MKLVIIRYNAGNIRSVLFALQRAGVEAVVTDDPGEIKSADKIIFPGVGEASSAMNYLREKKLDLLIRDLSQPVLGICLGMQLLCRHSEEGDTPAIGIFPVEVKKFVSENQQMKIPQMGWNTITQLQSPMFKGIAENSYVYFVHGYYAALCEQTAAVTDYIQPYSSALQYKNFYACQFHPEKSGDTGEQIIRNFLSL